MAAQHALWSSTRLRGACKDRSGGCVNANMATLLTYKGV